jgi:iron(II)-dependent oxidoreductase
MALQLFSRRSARKPDTRPRPASRKPAPAYEAADPIRLEGDPLRQCLQLERYGILLGDPARWADHPEAEGARRTARERIDEAFAIVPEGFASLQQVLQDEPGAPETCVETEAFLLAREAVTHAQYQKFVDGGGYEQLDLWPQEIWPHLIDFKDLTDRPGPRFWRGGRHPKALADHPVVGVCQYEAEAYARWVGLRLPTEAEWQMAATWRIRSAANVLRRYPWGDAMDSRRCNIWGSGVGRTLPVHACANGAAPNQVLQLIGNVWEWTSGELNLSDAMGRNIFGDMALAPIRGGAFDTYFPAQATGLFRTGLVTLARAHNVGFRLAADPGVVGSSSAGPGN